MPGWPRGCRAWGWRPRRWLDRDSFQSGRQSAREPRYAWSRRRGPGSRPRAGAGGRGHGSGQRFRAPRGARPRPWPGHHASPQWRGRPTRPAARRSRLPGRERSLPCSGSGGRRRPWTFSRRGRYRRPRPCDTLCGQTPRGPRARSARAWRSCSQATSRGDFMTLIRIGHSPDPDDAFMFYALTAGKVKAEGIEVEHVLEDIESLNRRARTGELEVTAVSAATYVMVHEQYRMMDPGASMGKGYGPILVGREPVAREEIEQKVIAIPGSHTTAALLLRLYVGDPPIIEVSFDKIPKAVLEGQADLGLLIHEGQITHQQMGLVKVLDMGQEWERDSGLPLPLGINVMRRDLGEAMHRKISQALRDSIDYAYANVDEALEYAMRYGRGIDKETCRKFVLMYVNDYTKRLGPDGKAALERLYTLAHARKLIPAIPPVDPI